MQKLLVILDLKWRPSVYCSFFYYFSENHLHDLNLERNFRHYLLSHFCFLFCVSSELMFKKKRSIYAIFCVRRTFIFTWNSRVTRFISLLRDFRCTLVLYIRSRRTFETTLSSPKKSKAAACSLFWSFPVFVLVNSWLNVNE